MIPDGRVPAAFGPGGTPGRLGYLVATDEGRVTTVTPEKTDTEEKNAEQKSGDAPPSAQNPDDPQTGSSTHSPQQAEGEASDGDSGGHG